MTELPNTTESVSLIQEFLNETRKRLSEGTEITFSHKANMELQVLALDFDLNVSDIEAAIENLDPENY